MNHVAWRVPHGKLKDYRKTLKTRGVDCSPILRHADTPGGYAKELDDSVTFLSFYFRGPDGESVPGITSTDLSPWSMEDLELFLEVGITPSGDFSGGHMTDVIEYSTGLLIHEDRSSIAQFLLSEQNNP